MNWYEPTEDQRASWEEWVSARPGALRALIAKFGFEPWKLYRLKTSKHRVTIHSFDEEASETFTLRVNVTGEFNFVAMERCVFGIKPVDLEECELPGPDELLGSANMTPDQVRAWHANRPS